MSDCGCFPDAAELARLAENAQAGRREAFVGTGNPDTVLACVHGEVRLGDAMTLPPPACTETTKAGEPCGGRPGPDGLCAAHKPKGDADAPEGAVAPAGDADQAQAGDGGQEAGDGGTEGSQVSGG